MGDVQCGRRFPGTRGGGDGGKRADEKGAGTTWRNVLSVNKGIRLRGYEKKWLRSRRWGVGPSQLCSEASCVDGAGQGSRQDLRRFGGTERVFPPWGTQTTRPPVMATAARTLCPGVGSARLPGWLVPQRCLWSLIHAWPL